MANENRKSIDLTPSDQERLQRIVDHVQRTTGALLDLPKANRVALSAWEDKNLPKAKKIAAAGPSIARDPEANERWQEREADRQRNPED